VKAAMSQNVGGSLLISYRKSNTFSYQT
jgi:hypothetical protein